jgi:hypothetical protein
MLQGNDFCIDPTSVEGTSDADLAWAVIEPLWDAIDFSQGYRAVVAVLALATPGQRGLFALDWCQKEIRNGGFEQFFLNSTGMLSLEALEGFHLVGATAYAGLLARALLAFPDGVAPRTKAARARALAQLGDRVAFFAPLDQAFLTLLEADDLEVYRARFVREHPEQFFRDG